MTVRARLAVAARVLLAVLGGYALAALATAGLALTLPMARAEAVTTATLLSFAIYAGAVVWVFAARRLASACVGLAVPALALGGLVWLLRGAAGG